MSHKLCQPDMRNISHVCILYMTLDIITMLSFRDSPFNNCLQATATHLIVHGALKLLGAETITIFGHNIYSYRKVVSSDSSQEHAGIFKIAFSILKRGDI